MDDDTSLPEVSLPEDLIYRLNKTMIEELVVRNRNLEALVSLQETELTLLWLALLGSIVYTCVATRNRSKSNG
jgi:hypothetical protein